MWRFLVFLALTNIVACSTYEKTNKDSFRDDTKPFRRNKHNLLWEKASKTLGPTDLARLRLELKKLDKISMEVKHAEDEHSDEIGELIAEERERFIEITERYGLVSNEVNPNENLGKKQFNHEKVKKLWEKAMYEGSFKQDELESLKKELDHHEDKIKEYHMLAELIDNHDAISENDISSIDRPNQTEMKMKKRELKDKFHEINRHYAVLNDKVEKSLPEPVEEFRDPRVLDLWRKANQLGFPQEELESIREELRHFQKRIDKHNHWKDEHSKLEKQGKKKEEDATFAHVSQKLQEHGKYVKKYHATMVDRVFKRDEL